tara:strand:+ start:55030 stop:55578 length:549 start_codon:yes stop_codon:yes gene_type:complete
MKYSNQKHVFEVFSYTKAPLGLIHLHSSKQRRVQTIASTSEEITLRIDYQFLFFKFYDTVYITLSQDKRQVSLSAESTFSIGIKRRAGIYFNEINNHYLYSVARHRQRESAKKIKEVEPPWKKFPNFSPGDMFWRQSGEYYLDLIWEPFWIEQTEFEKAQYVRKFSAPDEWLEWLAFLEEQK